MALASGAAARKASGKQSSLVAYAITKAGAEPVAERRSPIDYGHYVQKQVRAVAEPVLALPGLEFDRIIGDDAQIRLFRESTQYRNTYKWRTSSSSGKRSTGSFRNVIDHG
jgi:hypothetical protein